MPFKKPELHTLYAKVLLIGDAGSGKTRAALTFPMPAVIDTEGSVDLYATKFDFVSESTQSLTTTLGLLKDIKAGKVKVGNLPCGTIVIDSLTSLYNNVQYAAMSDDGDIAMQNWAKIKREFRNLTKFLYEKLKVHVVCTSQIKPKYVNPKKDSAASKAGELEVDGEIIDCDKNVRYLFDLILWMRSKNGKHTAEVLKARGIFGDNLNEGQIIENFGWHTLEPIFANINKGKKDKAEVDEPDSIEADKTLFAAKADRGGHVRKEQEKIETPEQEIRRLAEQLIKTMNLDPGEPLETKSASALALVCAVNVLDEVPTRWGQVKADQIRKTIEFVEKA